MCDCMALKSHRQCWRHIHTVRNRFSFGVSKNFMTQYESALQALEHKVSQTSALIDEDHNIVYSVQKHMIFNRALNNAFCFDWNLYSRSAHSFLRKVKHSLAKYFAICDFENVKCLIVRHSCIENFKPLLHQWYEQEIFSNYDIIHHFTYFNHFVGNSLVICFSNQPYFAKFFW